MRVSNLFVIAALVGAVAVIGCDDDGGTGGTAGNGGTAGDGGNGGNGGAAPCTGEECTQGSQAKTDCEDFVTDCEAAGAGGAGGAPIQPEQCATIGFAAFCSGGAGGAGGAGGSGGAGGTGGTGPDLGCNVLACQTDDELKAKCEQAVRNCLVYCENEECAEDECLGLGLLICNVAG